MAAVTDAKSPQSPLTDASAARINTTPTRLPVRRISLANGASKTPDDNVSPQWSSAVGPSSLGKSGRVIERLMADIDRLKRSLNAEISLRQETSKREDLNLQTIAALRAENENLLLGKEVDAGLLRRRERKIDELKGEVTSETALRKKAESHAATAEAEREAISSKYRLETAALRDETKHATQHATILQSSHAQLRTEYTSRLTTITTSLQRLAEERDAERSKTKALATTVANLQNEVDKTSRTNQQIAQLFEEYQGIAGEKIQVLERQEKRRDDEEKEFRKEAERVMHEARHIIGVVKAVRGDDGKALLTQYD